MVVINKNKTYVFFVIIGMIYVLNHLHQHERPGDNFVKSWHGKPDISEKAPRLSQKHEQATTVDISKGPSPLLGKITRSRRARAVDQQGATIWLSGLSADDMAQVTTALENYIYSKRHVAYRIDDRMLTYGLNSNLGKTQQDITEGTRRAGHLAATMADAGLISILSTASTRLDRERVRAVHEQRGLAFFEIHLTLSSDTNDQASLWTPSQGNEAPLRPELEIDITHMELLVCVKTIHTFLKAQKVLAVP